MTGQPRFRLACLGAIVPMAACLPLDDLSGYSGASVAPFAGGNGSGGSTSGGASSGAPATAGANSGQSGEGSGGALPLDPSGVAGGAGGSAPAPVASADAGSCDGPDEFAGPEARGCYQLTVETAAWLDARAACVSWGGDLVSIESADEDDFLTARLTTNVWIGVNDREVEGTMVWADGSPLGYANWGDAQPDDFNAQEDCGEKRVLEGGDWNDSPCDGMPREFLCER